MKHIITPEVADQILPGVLALVQTELAAKNDTRGKAKMLATFPSEWKWLFSYACRWKAYSIQEVFGKVAAKNEQTEEELDQEWREKLARTVGQRIDGFLDSVCGISIIVSCSRIYVSLPLKDGSIEFAKGIIRERVEDKIQKDYDRDQVILKQTPDEREKDTQRLLGELSGINKRLGDSPLMMFSVK